METKFHGLPPMKRLKLLQQQEHQNDAMASSCLPAKKRQQSRDPPPPITTATCFLPVKKRVWALPPDVPISFFDLNVEYKPSKEEEIDLPSPKPISPTKEAAESIFEEEEADNKTQIEQAVEEEEGDDGILCAVCGSTDGDPSDPIVFCDGCDLMVHTTCYGDPLIKGVPEGNWFCNQCLNSHKSPKMKNILSCCLCPVTGGALKPTTDGRWAHIVCSLFVPEVFFSDPEGREGIDCSMIPARRWEQRCYVCGCANAGCAIDCSEHKCVLAFHVTCGLKQDLYIEYREGKNKRAVVAGFCKTHTDLWNKQQQTGKFKIVAREDYK